MTSLCFMVLCLVHVEDVLWVTVGDYFLFIYFFYSLIPQMRLKVHSFGMLHSSAQTIKNSCFS